MRLGERLLCSPNPHTWRQNHRGSGRPSPRGRNGCGPTPRGDRGRGGRVTLGPDPPPPPRPPPPRGGQATWATAATQASSHDTPGPMSPTGPIAYLSIGGNKYG